MTNAWLAFALRTLAPDRCPGCDALCSRAFFCDLCVGVLDPDVEGGGFVYGGPMADAIRRWKFGGRADLGRALASVAAEAFPAVDNPEETWIVPVPGDPAHRASRGFEPQSVLAHAIARARGARVGHGFLRRLRRAPPQASLDREARFENVAGLYRGAAPAEGKRVWLVDDVTTTGATLDAAADALDDAGVELIGTWALAVRRDAE